MGNFIRSLGPKKNTITNPASYFCLHVFPILQQNPFPPLGQKLEEAGAKCVLMNHDPQKIVFSSGDAHKNMSSFKHLQFSSINSLFHPLRNSYEWMQPGGMRGLIRVLSSTL